MYGPLSFKRAENWREGIRIPHWIPWCYVEGVRDLPTQPIWPGFAVNTMFYAAILWVLFAIPGALRRTLRRRRGRCVKCGYDLRGAAHDACPECGRLTPSPSDLGGRVPGNG